MSLHLPSLIFFLSCAEPEPPSDSACGTGQASDSPALLDSSPDSQASAPDSDSARGEDSEPEEPPPEPVLAEQGAVSWDGPPTLRERWVAEDMLGVDDEPADWIWMYPEAGADKARGMLILVHGSTAADDGTDPSLCEVEDALTSRERLLDTWGLIPWLAARQGWTVLAPLNRWCDVWLGQGEEDPHDSRHRGWELLERSYAWARERGVTGPAYTWGSSTGGVGAALLAARAEGIEGVLMDSTPADFFNEEQTSFVAVLRHVLGGGPEKLSERYRESSPVSLIEDGALLTPVYVVDNTLDDITVSGHGQAMVRAMSETLSAEGIDWQHQDLNHMAPFPSNHVQAGLPLSPWMYTAAVAMEFLDRGGQLAWIEAEGEGVIRSLGTSQTAGTWATSASQGEVLEIPQGAAGEVLRWEAPSIYQGERLRLHLVLGASDWEALPADTPLAWLRWRSGEEVLSESVLCPEHLGQGELGEAIEQQLARSRLEADFDGSELTFQLESSGAATLRVDALALFW